MTKNVKATIDIEIARRMLRVAGFAFVDNMTDDEVFEQALKMNEEYAVESTIITLPDMREKVKEYLSELDVEIDRCEQEAVNHSDSKIDYMMYMVRLETLVQVKSDLRNRLEELV